MTLWSICKEKTVLREGYSFAGCEAFDTKPLDDLRQIARWRAVRRHVAPIEKKLQTLRSKLPSSSTPGVAALGLRFTKDLIRAQQLSQERNERAKHKPAQLAEF